MELSTTPRWVEEGFTNSGEYEFNGTNTYIKVVDSNYFNMNDKITLSAWIKHKQTTGIIDCVAHFNGLRFYINKTNKLYIKFTTTSNDVTFTGSVPIDDSGNVWTHLVLTYGGSRVKGYINGVLDPNLDFSTSGLLRKSNIGYIGVFDAS